MSEDPSAEPRTGAQTAPQPSSEMLNRIGSGIVLAVLALGLLYAGTAPFALLVGLAGVLTSFEWSRIVRGPEFDAALVIQILAAGLAALLGGMGLSALGLAVVAAGTILVGLLTFGERPILSALGVLYAGLPAVALLWLRDDYPHGLYAVLFVLAAVVATDVAAFFTGRLAGGPKLAPAISPKKTWSGLVGGVAAAALAGLAMATAVGAPAQKLAIAGALLGLVAQIGDLFESALKRRFDLKDSGHIIPGHGGVMDRVDGLVFASIAAALAALVLNPQWPATALLFGG